MEDLKFQCSSTWGVISTYCGDSSQKSPMQNYVMSLWLGVESKDLTDLQNLTNIPPYFSRRFSTKQQEGCLNKPNLPDKLLEPRLWVFPILSVHDLQKLQGSPKKNFESRPSSMSSAALGGHLQATWPTEGRCSMLEVGRRFAHLVNLASNLHFRY